MQCRNTIILTHKNTQPVTPNKFRPENVTLSRKYIQIQDVLLHYNDVIMNTMASQITSLTIVYSTVYSGADQRKHQSSASLAFVWGIHRSVTRKMFSFDDVIMRMYSSVNRVTGSGSSLSHVQHQMVARVKVGNIAHMVWIVSWVISRTLTAILPDFQFQWLVPVKWILWHTSYHTQEIMPQKHILYC